jgi:hypothetical protein
MKALAIIGLCILAASFYGVLHDQVTARVCVEYFTIGHPPIFRTDNPTLLGLGWGVLGTWWVGALLGVPLAIVARAGHRPPREPRSLLRPLLILLLVMGCCALAAGMIGWRLADSGVVFLIGPISQAVPAERHVPFIADLWAHGASYGVGLIGGVVLMIGVWRSRRKRPYNESP